MQEILRSYNAGYRALQDCKNEVQSHKTLLHESYSKFHSVKKIAESFTDVEVRPFYLMHKLYVGMISFSFSLFC